MNLPFAYGIPPATARLRQTPEDFQVEEQLGFEPDGEGEHLWLWVEKRGLNSEQLARELARLGGMKAGEIGYAGMKDRHALTRQWFSVPVRHAVGDALQWCGAGWRVLHGARARRKLRRGGLRGNRFMITLREVRGDLGAIEARLQEIAVRGVPNYFGEQRFGHDNLARAEAMVHGELRVADRHVRGLYLSSVRAALFNSVAARRVRDRTWDQALPGEALNLDGSRSFFVIDAPDEAIARRLAAGDVHPTGPLWGKGEPPSRGEALAADRAAMVECPDWWRDACCRAGMEQERRPLRLVVRELQWQWGDGGRLCLGFALAAGGYATAVLRELAASEPAPLRSAASV